MGRELNAADVSKVSGGIYRQDGLLVTSSSLMGGAAGFLLGCYFGERAAIWGSVVGGAAAFITSYYLVDREEKRECIESGFS